MWVLKKTFFPSLFQQLETEKGWQLSVSRSLIELCLVYHTAVPVGT